MQARSADYVQKCLPVQITHQAAKILASPVQVFVLEARGELGPVAAEIIARVHWPPIRRPFLKDQGIGSYSIEFPIPFHETRNPDFDRNLRLEAGRLFK